MGIFTIDIFHWCITKISLIESSAYPNYYICRDCLSLLPTDGAPQLADQRISINVAHCTEQCDRAVFSQLPLVLMFVNWNMILF